MSWTKLQLVEKAYEKAGLASYFFDLEPNQKISACNDMDSMVASWEAGVCARIGYPISSSPENNDISADSGVPDWANAAIYLNLAVYVCLNIGRVAPPNLVQMAKDTYKNLVNKVVSMSPPLPYQFPSTMPRGAGQKYWRGYNNPFFPTPCDPVDAGPDGPIDLN